MTKPGPMQWIADPPELWGKVVDVLIDKLQDLAGKTACPPWPGQARCPLKAEEQCWGEHECWLYWAYMMAVIQMTTENMKKATDLQGVRDGR